MTEPEARDFFLEKIRNRLGEQGHVLQGQELEYGEALRPLDEKQLDLLIADKKPRKVFAEIEERFESAWRDSVANDGAGSANAREHYKFARRAMTSADGIQLQALVYAATSKFAELDDPSPWWRSALITALVAVFIAPGAWIGSHRRR